MQRHVRKSLRFWRTKPMLQAKLKSMRLEGSVWRIRRRMEIPQLDGPVAAFCGIARPDQFFEGLESAGVKLATRTAFADHYIYTAADLARIESQARSAGARALLTTEKDRIRLGGLAASLPEGVRLRSIPLRTEIEREPAAIDWLIDHLHGPR